MAQDFVVLVESGRNDVVAIETDEELVQLLQWASLGQSKSYQSKPSKHCRVEVSV